MKQLIFTLIAFCTLQSMLAMKNDTPKNLNLLLLKAAQTRSLAKIKKLVKLGADVNCREEIQLVPYQPAKGLRTPLLCVALSATGHDSSETICEFLIENGANINATCHEGYTPLMCACALGRVNLCALFLKRGALIPITTPEQETVLHVAAILRHRQPLNSCAINFVVDHQQQMNTALTMPFLLCLNRLKQDPEQSVKKRIIVGELYREFRRLLLPHIRGYISIRDLLNMRDSKGNRALDYARLECLNPDYANPNTPINNEQDLDRNAGCGINCVIQ